jgi:hypothetical protein
MNAQLLFFRIVSLATAVIVLFLVIHSAAQAFTQSAGVLTQALQ